jgi:hypothetical protein
MNLEATPWMDAYRRVLTELIRPGEFEFLNHPMACIVAVSSENPDPINSFESGYNPLQV